MKKLKMLIITILMISIHSLGQGTNNSIPNKDTSGINLPKAVAKETAKDLLKGDSAVAELSKTQSLLNEEKIKSRAKDSIISIKDQQIGTYKEKEKSYNDVIFLKDSQIDFEQQISKKLAADLRAIKRKKTFMEVAGTAIIAGLTYLYLTK